MDIHEIFDIKFSCRNFALAQRKRKCRLVRLMKQIFRVATSKPWPFVVRSTATLCPKAGVTHANALLCRLQILLITIKMKFAQPVYPNFLVLGGSYFQLFLQN